MAPTRTRAGTILCPPDGLARTLDSRAPARDTADSLVPVGPPPAGNCLVASAQRGYHVREPGENAPLLTRLPVGLLGLLLLVLPGAPTIRVATPATAGAARVTLERLELTPALTASAVERSPLFDDLPGAAPTPLAIAIATAAPDVDDEARLQAAVAQRCPSSGGRPAPVGARRVRSGRCSK
jgi:hypothetical protein